MAYEIKNAEGQVVTRNGVALRGFDYLGTVKSVDLKKRTLSMRGSDETRDRDGDVIEQKGWQLENYLKNPVFLWAHDYRSIPIGRTNKLSRKRSPEPHLSFDEIKFPSEGLFPMADLILNLFAEKIINASSVGFIPSEWRELTPEEREASGRPTVPGYRFTKQELLELSGCAVPSNPSALANAFGALKSIKGIGSPEELANMIAKGTVIGELCPSDEHIDDIMEEMSVSSLEIEDELGPKIFVPKAYECTLEEEPEPPAPTHESRVLVFESEEKEEKTQELNHMVEFHKLLKTQGELLQELGELLAKTNERIDALEQRIEVPLTQPPARFVRILTNEGDHGEYQTMPVKRAPASKPGEGSMPIDQVVELTAAASKLASQLMVIARHIQQKG